jgi:uncharacterized protein
MMMKIKANTLFLIGVAGTALFALSLFLVTAFSIDKPQDPVGPYPYISEDITFAGPAPNLTLAGTLTFPREDSPFPVAILISGSGPQNRNEELVGHRPFLVLADHLTKNGIAVLRYDDRGVSKSTGDFSAATTADFAADVKSAIAYLKTRAEIDEDKIGLIGHSEGGVIAPMVASSSDDVSFIVLLAGPGIELRKVLTKQQEVIPRAMGISENDIQKAMAINAKTLEMIMQSHDRETLRADLIEYAEATYDEIPGKLMPPKMSKEKVITMQANLLSSPWYKNLLIYDPAPALEKVKCPVLALNGEKDLQVSAKENLAGIQDALTRGGNTNVTVKELAGMNHLFQECETGSLAEYEKIKQTFSPIALTEISDWILKQVK